MSFNPSDMELTPVQIFWTPAGSTAEVDLGASLGNVKIAVAIEKAPLKADQTGSYILDQAISGGKYSVTTEIAQTKDFQLAGYLFPTAASVVGTTPYDGASPSAAIQFNNYVGSRSLAVAGNLRLHPQNLAAANTSYDFNFFKACPVEMSEISYGPSEQSRWKVEWMVFPDTSVTPYKFFRYGKTSIT